MSPFYDLLETRDPAERDRAQRAAVARCIAQIRQATPTLAQWFQDVDLATLHDRAAWARLPVLRKSELMQRQQQPGATQAPPDPFGGFATIGWRGLAARTGARRVFQSPGPIYEPQGQGTDYWRLARALWAAGFRAGDLIHCSFSFHLTPAGAMVESAAHALGCTMFPGGVGQTELQLRAITDLQPQGYVGTPSFLKVLLDQADSRGLSLPSLTRALVSGEALPASLRASLSQRGIEALQCYASADLGLIAYETPAREGLVVDEGVIVEIVRPGTGEPLPEGQIGEVLVTVPNPHYPLIRFGTGDLSAVLPGPCPSGRTHTRLRGWLGRADQATKVRGMFVHPTHVTELLARHPEVLRARLVVSGDPADSQLLLRAEVSAPAEGLAPRLTETLRHLTRLRCDIEVVAPGSLPDDGRLVEDARADV